MLNVLCFGQIACDCYDVTAWKRIDDGRTDGRTPRIYIAIPDIF